MLSFHLLQQPIGQHEQLTMLGIDTRVTAFVAGLPQQGTLFRIKARGKEADPAAAAMLRLIHGLIGVVHQGFGILPVLGIERQPDTAGDKQLLLLQLEWMAQLLVQLVGHRQHFVASLRQQDNELVAPPAVPPGPVYARSGSSARPPD